MAKILKFTLQKDDEENKGFIRRIRKFISLGGENKVVRLIPKDEKDRFGKMPLVDGEEIASFRDFLTYIVRFIYSFLEIIPTLIVFFVIPSPSII